MASDRSRPVALIVLDGWGYREATEGNAIALADTPAWDSIWRHPGRTLLEASGLRVGLPEGQIGNSEVGHLNLGAGRVVMQDLVRISASIRDGSFFAIPALVDACRRATATGGTLHLLGLVGDGGVHAIDEHLYALVDLARHEGVPRVAIHAFMDGRDTLPKSGLSYMDAMLAYADAAPAGDAVASANDVRVASVSGRYYAMDRDRRWNRTELAYRAIVDGAGPRTPGPREAILAAYDAGITDEFIHPVTIVQDGAALAPMRDGDSVICFNYRSDRMRQMVRALADPDFDGFDV
ncbi:MAG: 2,3-bisphosphoglycerate-independent phosphoglycerate mutase, partial [Gemmatimonadota bacterium]|nr:2,3-bisphosphoglycerate-independent phosphoglycerate mutase [Gemmatimonadota bacterium]